jgi:hypothetical protein
MRIVFFAIALTIAAPVCAQTVSDNLDRISGERTVSYTADGSRDTSMPVFTFEAILAGHTSSSSVNLAFVSGAGSRFAACHGIEWLADGRPVPASPSSYSGKMVDGEMIELIGQNVTVQRASDIGGARDVRYRVCRNEYALTHNDIEAFARIAAKLKGAALSPASARANAPATVPAKGEVEYKGMNWRPKNPGSF